MGRDYHARREGPDYSLTRGREDGPFLFEDKRTGHCMQFHECIVNGYGGTVLLYYHPNSAPEDAGRSAGYKCGFLDKDSLPEWLITEFAHINDWGEMRPQTDPRGDD